MLVGEMERSTEISNCLNWWELFLFLMCLFLPPGNHSCSTCPARLMAPVLMSFQVCSRVGILFLFQAGTTQALSCFWELTPCSQEVLGHKPTTAASLTGETKVPLPSLSPQDDHPGPPGKEQGCLSVLGRVLNINSPRARCPAEQKPFCVQALSRAHQRLGRCSSCPCGHWGAHGGHSPTLALEAAQHPRCSGQEGQ